MKHKTSLLCPNRKCSYELHPVGNFSYGSSSLALGIRKYTLILISVFSVICFIGALLPDDWTRGVFDSVPIFLIYFYLAPIFLVFLVTTLIPNSTVISCHYCGHRSEHYRKLITPGSLPPADDHSPPELKPNEVVDHSLIDLNNPPPPSKKKKKEKRAKKRRYFDTKLHTPFLRKR